MAKLLLAVWIALFAGLFYMSIRFADPGPPKPWRHEFDTPAITGEGTVCQKEIGKDWTCTTGQVAYCVLDDQTIVLPGAFCTREGWDAE